MEYRKEKVRRGLEIFGYRLINLGQWKKNVPEKAIFQFQTDNCQNEEPALYESNYLCIYLLIVNLMYQIEIKLIYNQMK